MSARGFLVPLALLCLLVAAVAFLRVPFSSAQTQCPAGTHVAAAGEAPGVPAGTCTPNNTANLLYGGCSFNPYPVLEQFKSGSNILITPSGTTGSLQNGINPALACRLATFLQYAQQSHGCTFKVSSGYRSAQTQANTCQSMCGNAGGCHVSSGDSGDCGAPGGSCHQYGLAVDINGSAQCMNWAHSLLGVRSTSSAGAQQFKIFFPISSDGVHVQCIENPIASCSASTKPCDGSIAIHPDLSVLPSTGPSALDNAIRQALGMNAQPPAPPQQPAAPQPTASTSAAPAATAATPASTAAATPPPIGSQNTTAYAAGTCSPQFYCSGTTYFYRNSTCVDQTYQSCPYGCAASGSTCALAPQSSSSSPSLLSNLFATSSTAGIQFDASATSGPSAFDLISAYANAPSDTNTAEDIGTGTPLALNADTQTSIGQIQAAPSYNSQGQPIASSGSGNAPQVIVQQPQEPIAQQTFTSSDFGSGTAPASAPPQNGALLKILGLFKQILTYALSYLNYLKPFGGTVPSQTYAE